ncbi:Helix-turn-helix domain-containing protein [Burkholderia sp. CF099]|nr:Helix-turn-helix domain-containing protein [Burkholderia sp. CF099]
MEQQEARQTANGVFSVNDFCQWAGIGRTAVYAEMKAGRLSARKFGRRTIIPQVEAERWLASLPMQRHS